MPLACAVASWDDRGQNALKSVRGEVRVAWLTIIEDLRCLLLQMRIVMTLVPLMMMMMMMMPTRVAVVHYKDPMISETDNLVRYCNDGSLYLQR